MATWKEDVITALTKLGGAGSYNEIYAEVAALRQSPLPREWQAPIRRTIEMASSDSRAHVPGTEDLFYSVDGIGSGTWGLRALVSKEGGDPGEIAENPDTGQGYAIDSVVRMKIEEYAVEAAEQFYFGRGAESIERLGKPYDLLIRQGDTETHVEVKGSTRILNSVTLTKNEVEHARTTPGTELFVVDNITFRADRSGDPQCSGGRQRRWIDWAPNDESLTPTVFSYHLPIGGNA